MPGVKRPQARIIGESRAKTAAVVLGREIRLSRQRRRILQRTLAARVGISQARLADIEAGRAAGAPAEVWFALAEALGRYLRFEFGRDPQAELADAGHLDIQELVLKVGLAGGWERVFEARSREWGPIGRSTSGCSSGCSDGSLSPSAGIPSATWARQPVRASGSSVTRRSRLLPW
jgi:transcriptional regulator with XRE-family HTH domain